MKFMGDVPFRHVYITGLIRDENGDKMSKSKGNVIDPIDIIDGITIEDLVSKRTTGLMQPHLAPGIEKKTRKQFPEGIAPYGTDALRFTFASLAGPARDINFDLGRVGGYRNFCNKLWNAARFVLGSRPDGELTNAVVEPSLASRWIASRLAMATEQATRQLDALDLAGYAATVYDVAWSDYCDWFLEMAKVDLRRPAATEGEKSRAWRTARDGLAAILATDPPWPPDPPWDRTETFSR